MSGNTVILLGRLGDDIELKNGNHVNYANFNLATHRNVKQNDEWKPETTWHRIVCFGKKAEYLSSYAEKGSLVYIIGRLSTRDYEKEGEKRYITEVICEEAKILSSKNNDNNQISKMPVTAESYLKAKEGLHDDIPF